MQILKHQKNGRMFIATPKLMRNKKMIPVTEDEAKEYIASLSVDKVKAYEDSKDAKEVALMAPDDLDLSVNISTFSKSQLIHIAKKINLAVPTSLKVKQLRPLVAEALEKLREDQDPESSNKVQGLPENEEVDQDPAEEEIESVVFGADGKVA